jgi:hypothetical protein
MVYHEITAGWSNWGRTGCRLGRSRANDGHAALRDDIHEKPAGSRPAVFLWGDGQYRSL